MTKSKLPHHGPCFICGPDNPNGLGVDFYDIGDGRVETRFRFGLSQQGPPGHAHGGSIAAVLDEVMGAAVWRAGHPVLAARLEIDYRKPTPLDKPLVATGWVVSVRGKQVRARGELHLEHGHLLAESAGLFVHARHVIGPAYLDARPYGFPGEPHRE